MTLRELHLFAGAGGGILGGMLLGHRCVGAVEISPYCRKVLETRQAEGHLEKFPIHDDVRTFDGKTWRGKVDVVCGGFPCQPWSSAGKRLGKDDPRHLWPGMARIVDEIRPRFVFAENVSLAAFAEPWRDLRGMGYRVPPALCLAASDVGAPHQRKRWWLLAADTDRSRLEGRDGSVLQECAGQLAAGASSPPHRDTVPDANSVIGREGAGGGNWQEAGDGSWWKSEPDVGRVADGVARRVDRLRATGNGQVPAVAAAAWTILMRRMEP